MVKSTFWPYSVDTYDLFKLVLENPRIPKLQISRKFKVNGKTGATWWDAAIEKEIILPPMFKRKSFLNFREYYYYLETDDPHELYERLKESRKEVTYFNVQTGFSNFQVVSRIPVSLPGEVVLSGERSNFFVSIPPRLEFEQSVLLMERKLSNIDNFKPFPTPLVYHEKEYVNWDEDDENIYQELCNNMRRPFARVLEEANTYSDKIMKWIRRRNEFGHTIVMYFPRGLSSYLPTVYCVETENDSLLIDIFSSLPTSTVFFRVGGKLLVSLYLPFSLEGRYIVRKVMSTLKKKELVSGYTNSIVEYYYRMDV